MLHRRPLYLDSAVDDFVWDVSAGNAVKKSYVDKTPDVRTETALLVLHQRILLITKIVMIAPARHVLWPRKYITSLIHLNVVSYGRGYLRCLNLYMLRDCRGVHPRKTFRISISVSFWADLGSTVAKNLAVDSQLGLLTDFFGADLELEITN